MSETTELTLSTPETLIANNATSLPAFNAPLQQWAREALAAARLEYEEMDLSVRAAKKSKWNPRPLMNARSKALARWNFYEKVQAALENGYMLFPPVPNADLIAVRTDMEPVRDHSTGRPERWNSPGINEHTSEGPPIGEGEYRNPYRSWVRLRTFKNEKNEDRAEWELYGELKNPVFPLSMAKPEIIEATNAAMEGKFFDEIRLFPFTKRRGDPCILGSIFNPKEDRRLYFLISWRINKGDL